MAQRKVLLVASVLLVTASASVMGRPLPASGMDTTARVVCIPGKGILLYGAWINVSEQLIRLNSEEIPTVIDSVGKEVPINPSSPMVSAAGGSAPTALKPGEVLTRGPWWLSGMYDIKPGRQYIAQLNAYRRVENTADFLPGDRLEVRFTTCKTYEVFDGHTIAVARQLVY